MKRELFFIALVLTLALAAAGCAGSDRPEQSAQPTPTAQTSNATEQASSATPSHAHGHEASAADAKEVPAFEVSEASLKNLPTTLSPAMFTGKTQQAYRAAQEIPQTLAQLPCYCHCDKGFGHKSLHSCYVDHHASMCAVCVDEALIAYRLQKEQHLKPEEIRERIIAVYSAQGF